MISNDYKARREFLVSETPATLSIDRYFSSSDLRLWEVTSIGVKHELTLGVHYTVSGNAITLNSRHGTGSSRIVVFHNPRAIQSTDYVDNDGFPADSHENALDRLTVKVRSLEEKIDRAISFDFADPEDQTPPSNSVPLEPRRGRVLAFDYDGAPEPGVSTYILEALINLNAQKLVEGITDYGSVLEPNDITLDYGTV